MHTKDVNGFQLARGDWVEPSDAMKMDDPASNYKLGAGQIEHIFTEGPRAGIYVRFEKVQRVANNGMALRKVSPVL